VNSWAPETPSPSPLPHYSVAVSLQRPALFILLCQVQEPLEVYIVYRDVGVCSLDSNTIWENWGSMFLWNVCACVQVHMVLPHSLPLIVGMAELLAQPFLVLYCHFSVSSSAVAYYGYNTEIVPICIWEALVIF
jgi:hypothetical protein